MNSEVRTRIAPSPTGDWHLGTARTALFAYLFARHHRGRFFLRIEDTDQARRVEGAEARIEETMSWLGLNPDPYNGQPYFRQSTNLDRYRQVAQELVEQGQAYYCFATPEELQRMRNEQIGNKLPPRYDNRWGWRDLPLEKAKAMLATAPHVIRFKMPQSGSIQLRDVVHGEVSVAAADFDDHILLKADGYPTYHLAHVVDDYDMAITHVIRGDEWLPSAPRHVALIDALGWPRPVYAHLPVILGSDKGKLSKRHGARPILEYRALGYLHEAVVNYLLLLGWSPGTNQEIFSLDEAAAAFDLDRVGPSPARFNAAKLDWYNAQYIRRLPRRELLDRLHEFWDGDAAWKARLASPKTPQILDVIADRMTTLAEFGPLTAIFFVRPTKWEAASLGAGGQPLGEAMTTLAIVRAVLDQSRKTWSYESLKTKLDGLVASHGLSVGRVYLPLRYALTGTAASPGALECLLILGPDESLARLDDCLRVVGEIQR